MSQIEIQSVYDNEHPLSGNGLKASFEFENAVNDSNNLISGYYDGAYRFEHQYVDIPDSNALDLTNEITISAWVYPTSGAQGYVVSKWRAYILQFTGTAYGNTMQGAIYNSGSFTPLATSTTIPLNTWSHVVFTYNKTISKIYINGELSGNTTSTASIDTNNNNLTIGGRNSTDRTRDFNGTIDEVHVYNTALRDDEIKELYEKGEITAKEYKDFNFRNYNPNLGIFIQPDDRIFNVYNPQNFNKYSFEDNSPYNKEDPTGHCPQCFAAVVGFTISSVGYMLTHDGSGWSHVGNTYAHGTIGAASAAASVSFIVTGGRVAATSGVLGLLSKVGQASIGAGSYALTKTIEDEEVDPTELSIAAALGLISPISLKEGSFVSSYGLTKNTLKISANQGFNSLISSFTTQISDTTKKIVTPKKHSGRDIGGLYYSGIDSGVLDNIDSAIKNKETSGDLIRRLQSQYN
jgi:RHS repeat-associated protein